MTAARSLQVARLALYGAIAIWLFYLVGSCALMMVADYRAQAHHSEVPR